MATPSDNSGTTVLVTGGSGFVGSWVVHQLLQQGYTVRTTVRSLSREEAVRSWVIDSSTPNARLTFHAADLEKDEGWAEACAGSDYVLHVASPFPATQPKNPDDLIRPARDGTLRALRFAKAAGVRRVVVTSSFAAIGYGHENHDKPFDETVWTNADSPTVSAYARSKTIAEKCAWDWLAKEGGSLELATINPVGIFGPSLGFADKKNIVTSLEIIRRVAVGGLPAAPKIAFGAVDVRDVAQLHILAMTSPQAAGERYLAVSDDGKFISLQDVGGALGKTIRTLPDWVVRFGALFSAELKGLTGELGHSKTSTNLKAREAFGHTFISWKESVQASEKSLKDLAVI
ncbi:hypothetical protein FH972_025127 [Carpinus fangiana]|uniref:Flavanone 4-reductase n=1 Tax=Carpinus fangiana TaxID=176857 RepID=A0A5N6L039_9ROSI|nr:hypothetical protein FH972_025127 [Carpinus fangiana]